MWMAEGVSTDRRRSSMARRVASWRRSPEAARCLPCEAIVMARTTRFVSDRVWRPPSGGLGALLRGRVRAGPGRL